MSEQRPIRLHLYLPKQVTDFGSVARSHGVKYEVVQWDDDATIGKPGGYYVTTENIAPTLRSKVIADWAKASMEIINS